MAERFKIFEQLGNSGAHVVLKGYDTQTQTYVTIKQLLTQEEEAALSEEQKSLLQSEAERLAGLKHPNFASFIDLTSNEFGTCAVTELLELNDISKLLMRGAIKLGDLLQIATLSLGAVHFAHQNNILHRAITPECIKVSRKSDGQLEVKIADFGFEHMSSIAGQRTEEVRRVDETAALYLAPEQFQGEPMDGRTDIYALGCIFYLGLSKQQAFLGANLEDTVERHLQQMVRPLSELCPQLPPALCDWVMWLINASPDYRPATAEAALESLKALEIDAPQQHTAAVKTITTATATVGRLKSGAVPRMKPVTSAIPSPQTSSIPLAQVAPPEGKSKLPLFIGGGVLVAIIAGWFLFSGESVEPLPPQPELPFPGDIIVHYKAAKGVVSIPPNNGDASKEKPAVVGDKVRWHDLATFNGDSTLKSDPNYAPVFNKVTFPPNKTQYPAVVFKHTDVLNTDAGDGAEGFPFNESNRKMGLTVVQVARFADEGRDLRSFCISHHWNDEARLYLHGLKDGTYEAYITSKFKQFKIKAPGSDCHHYGIVTIVWDGNNGTAQISVLGADGKRSVSPLVKDIPKPTKPAVTMQIGHTNPNDTNFSQKFAGEMLEVIVYNSVLPQKDREKLEKQLSAYYFGFQ